MASGAVRQAEWIDRAGPRARARLTGLIYLLYFLTAVLSAAVAPTISGLGGVPSDASTIGQYVESHVAAVRFAIALGLVSTGLYAALMVLFYQLFRPVSQTTALLAMVFGLIGSAITAVASMVVAAPIAILTGGSYLAVFDVKQLRALALLFLNLGADFNAIELFFFGLFQLALGYLIFRSTFVPRVIGVLIAIAGVAWFLYLAPPVATALMTPTEVLGFIAELSLMLWLLIRGVDPERWKERAGLLR